MGWIGSWLVLITDIPDEIMCPILPCKKVDSLHLIRWNYGYTQLNYGPTMAHYKRCACIRSDVPVAAGKDLRHRLREEKLKSQDSQWSKI